MWSLKSFSQSISPKPLAGTFRNFTTPTYKLHIMEVPTGIKLVLLTKPTSIEANELLFRLYQNCYVPLVTANIFSKPG